MFFDRSKRFVSKEAGSKPFSDALNIAAADDAWSSSGVKMVDDYYIRPQPAPPSSAKGVQSNKVAATRRSSTPDGEFAMPNLSEPSSAAVPNSHSPPLGRYTIFDIDPSHPGSPGPGAYSPQDILQVHGATSFSPVTVEKRLSSFTPVEQPGPGRYFHPSSLVKPSFNEMRNPRSKVSQDKAVSDHKGPKEKRHEIMLQLQQQSAVPGRSSLEERRRVKQNMQQVLRNCQAMAADANTSTKPP